MSPEDVRKATIIHFLVVHGPRINWSDEVQRDLVFRCLQAIEGKRSQTGQGRRHKDRTTLINAARTAKELSKSLRVKVRTAERLIKAKPASIRDDLLIDMVCFANRLPLASATAAKTVAKN